MDKVNLILPEGVSSYFYNLNILTTMIKLHIYLTILQITQSIIFHNALYIESQDLKLF